MISIPEIEINVLPKNFKKGKRSLVIMEFLWGVINIQDPCQWVLVRTVGIVVLH